MDACVTSDFKAQPRQSKGKDAAKDGSDDEDADDDDIDEDVSEFARYGMQQGFLDISVSLLYQMSWKGFS